MAVGALGSGALPVPNPLFGLRVLGLPAATPRWPSPSPTPASALVVLAWLWVGKMLRYRGAVAPAPTGRSWPARRSMWALPLAVAPPMFSRDVYSYLAQSAILARHLDPYVLGPAEALGVDDPLTRSIPTIWRDTPAPYGPLFLIFGRGITAISGNDVVLGVLEHRALALCGVAMIVWALPRLAHRCALDPGLALWLGAANPLVLFHLVSGIHNESLMIGLLLVGLELGLRAGPRLLDRHLLGGTALIVAASAVKLPALLALGFLGLEWARRRGGSVRDVAAVAAVMAAITVVIYTPLSVGTGVGLGWTRTLDTPSLILSWMSASTDLGLIGGQVGILGGLGDHTDTVLLLTRGVGFAGAAVRGRHAAAGHAARADRRRHRHRAPGWAPWCCSDRWCTPGTCCGRRSRWPPPAACRGTGGRRWPRRPCWPSWSRRPGPTSTSAPSSCRSRWPRRW